MGVLDNKDLVLRFLEDFAGGRMDAAWALLADEARWWVPGSFCLSGTYSKAEYRELVRGVVENLPKGFRLTPKSLTAEEDRVAVEAESYAEHKNGAVYNNVYHFLFVVRGGKIREVKEYCDTMHANDVLCS